MPSTPTNLPLPIIDLSTLSSPTTLTNLSSNLHTAFTTTGFAYLINAPLTLTHAEIITLSQTLFSLPPASKMSVAKKAFQHSNNNTYRGYFPAQPGPSDNLKEGFEIGPPAIPSPTNTLRPQNQRDPHATESINLYEANAWPADFTGREELETLWTELQSLSEKLLSLLALALGKGGSFFDSYILDSISTLRLLHYPAPQAAPQQQEFCCTPHTDSGILTLLHQDSTGGLEIWCPAAADDDDDDGEWIPAPYVPGSIVVNVGDLLSRVSGGNFKATRHRVRSSPGRERYSVPFFFEPGAGCLVGRVDGGGSDGDQRVVYGEHVLGKMSGWVEFQDGGKMGAVVGVESVEVEEEVAEA